MSTHASSSLSIFFFLSMSMKRHICRHNAERDSEQTSHTLSASKKCSAITVYLIVYICEWRWRSRKWRVKRNIKIIYICKNVVYKPKISTDKENFLFQKYFPQEIN
jgi:hypothetical protein